MKQLLSDSIDDYRKYRISQGLAKNTLRNDRQTLLAFLTYVGNIYTESVTEQKVTEFLAERTETRLPQSIGIDVHVLSGFFKWAINSRRARRDRDPMAGRKPPRAVQRERARVPVGQFPYLLEKAGERHPRDRAFIAVALFTLLRSSEIESIKVRDLHLDEQTISVTLHKTREVDTVPIPAELDRELRRWLVEYSHQCGNLDADWYLLPARRLMVKPGQPGNLGITRLEPTKPVTHSASQVVKPALRAIGFSVEGQEDLKGEGIHTLRRSSARALYDVLQAQGHDGAVRVVKTTLHHKDMATTESYLGVSADKRQRDDMLKGKSMFDLPQVEIGAVSGEGESNVVGL